MSNTAESSPAPLSRDELVLAHLDLVSTAAKSLKRKLYTPNVETDDLEGQGHIGLIEAAAAYDQSVGVPFPAFAWRYIHGRMVDAYRRRAFKDESCEPLPTWYVDPLANPEQRLVRAEVAQMITELIEFCSPREQRVLRLSVCEGLRNGEIGAMLGVSEGRVCQIKRRAVAKMRRFARWRGISTNSLRVDIRVWRPSKRPAA